MWHGVDATARGLFDHDLMGPVICCLALLQRSLEIKHIAPHYE
jgi:hypothetical protein